MSGEMIFAVGYGGILVVAGAIAYWWTLRSYAGSGKSADDDAK